MKLVVVAASLLASVNSQIVHSTDKKLDARCVFEDSIEKLVLDIPYPGADKANILALAAGTCNEVSFLTAENDGGRMDVGVDEDMVHLVIPIDACDIRGDVYQTPTVERSFGLIKPTANVTFGQNIAGQDIIFRHLPIAAECGTRTSYTVKFEYNDVKSADTEGCTDVDGVCVFPAYGEEAVFEIKEYTDNDYTVEVDDSNRAKTAGEQIFLSLQVTDLTTDLKFAVTECILKQKNDTSSDGITLLNPGEVYDSSVVGSEHPSCQLSEIDLRGTYDGFTRFNFQHLLFLLDATTDTNSFTLQCTIEVCGRDDASSVCNRAAAVCMNDSTDVNDIDAVDRRDENKKDYMCTGLCGVGKEDECSVDADTVSCKACTCGYGVAGLGSACPVTNTEVCLSCDSGYYQVGDTCVVNTCTCNNGVAAVGVDCSVDGDAICSGCDGGYDLTGTSCVASGPPRVFECNEHDTTEYKNALKKIFPKTCQFDPTQYISGIVDYTASPIVSNTMKVWWFKGDSGCSGCVGEPSIHDARKFCADKGLTVAQIHSENERDEMLNMQTTFYQSWLDGEWDSAETRNGPIRYKWKSTGQNMCIDSIWDGDWKTNVNAEPNSWDTGEEEFVALIRSGDGSYKMNDSSGGGRAKVICEYRCAI